MSSSDDEDDLFGAGSDSDDTAELIASSNRLQKQTAKPAAAAKKKQAPPPKKKKQQKQKQPANDSDDEGGGLFDSSSDEDDDDEEEEDSKPKALSKKERLQALAAKKRGGGAEPIAKTKKAPSSSSQNPNDASGYDSEDSYESTTYERTAADDDFLDTTGEDADAVKELYAEQHFDDVRGMDSKKKGKKRRYDDEDDDRPDRVYMDPNKVPDNPIMAAVHKMKKKKRVKQSFTEMEDECKIFLGKMEQAIMEDESCVAERKPATHKLKLLNDVIHMLTRKDTRRMLLDMDVLVLIKRWIQPLPTGQLGILTVRQRLLESVLTMTGETGITANDLKRSELGKVVMVLYKHKDETPTMKNGLLRKLIEQWSRPIFQKSANPRDLERVGSRDAKGLSALVRQQQQVARASSNEKAAVAAATANSNNTLGAMLKSGGKGNALAPSAARVSVPFSKGFQYTVRPSAKAATPEKTKQEQDTRGKLSRRMIEKTRAVSKNNRSANISIEGRPTK